MRDALLVELITPAAEDPNTGAPTGAATVNIVADQPCSDQDLLPRTRAGAIINGVPGVLGASRCYTAWFEWPAVPEGASLTVRVNGKFRPLLKAGPPADVAGQQGVYLLELGPPQDR